MASAGETRYPVYVISKGRWESRRTVRALESMGVPYRIVIEPQELPQYSATIDPAKILTLPFSNLGQGSIPARNWVWEHALAGGHERHWILDDNIKYFHRFHENRRYIMRSGAAFRAAEDFTDRYTNVALSGMQYAMFAKVKDEHRSPFITNTRIYSCILVNNRLPYRWRGRYNEDTDLSLRVLKDGWCTILFYAFLAEKTPTMTMKGGNTDELYRRADGLDGRLAMAQSLQAQHPDVVKIGRRWNRWQHVVDYRPFAGNKLIRLPDLKVKAGPDEYGMVLSLRP